MKAELITKNHLAVEPPSRGMSLIEVIIAMALLTLSIGAVIMLVFANQNLKIDVSTNNEARAAAEALIEELRAKSRSDFSSVVTVPPSTSGIYTKGAVVTDIDAFTKLIVTTVNWSESVLRPIEIKLSTIVTDPLSAFGGDTCSPTLSGDWTKPQDYKAGYGYFDFISPNGTSGLDAFNKKVYLTSDITGKDNFYIIDVSNPKPPPSNDPDLPKLGSLESPYGLTDVRVVGKYAYVAANSQAFEMMIIDISDPATLSAADIVKKVAVNTPYTGTGNTLFYAKKTIYLGLTKSTGPEFYIIDVTDPLNPVVKGSFETNTAINQIIVKDDKAYLAGARTNQAWILDVSDPLNPVQTNPTTQTFVDPSGTFDWSGQSIALSATKLFLGRIYNIGDNGAELFVLDPNDLSQPPLGSLTQTKQDGVSRMVIRQNLIFMSNAKHNDGFQIWDAANLSNITRYDTTPLNVEESSTAGMDCEGNFIYLGEKSGKALQIIGPYDPGVFSYGLSNPADVTVVRGGAGQITNFTATISGGITQPVNFTNSSLPAGVTMNYSSTSCSPTCSTTLTISANAGAALGAYPITISGDSPPRTATFNLTVNAPAFTYSFANIPDMTLFKGGPSVPVTVTVIMAAGAVPEAVTISAPNPKPSDIIITPASILSCTPTATSPYSCTQTFNYQATAAASNGNYNNQQFSGSPNSVESNKFRIRVQ